MGADEGGLEELVELSWSRASRSATRWSSSAIRHRSDSKAAMRAAWASGGMVFQRDSGIGRLELIHCDYVPTVQKVRRVSAYIGASSAKTRRAAWWPTSAPSPRPPEGPDRRTRKVPPGKS